LATSSWTAAADFEKDRHADEQPVDAVLALEVNRARQDTLPVPQDRVDHLERRCRRCVER
jgi:hypothetical protein